MTASALLDLDCLDRPAKLHDFVSLAQLFYGRPEMRCYLGSWAQRLLPVAATIMWQYIIIRHRRPRAILVTQGRNLLGGALLSRSGTFEMLTISSDRKVVLGVRECLTQALSRLVVGQSDRQFGFWTSSSSVGKGAQVLGFIKTQRVSYMRTVRLGCLSFSWQSASSCWLGRFARTTRTLYYWYRPPTEPCNVV